MRLLIIGGFGFLGHNLIPCLKDLQGSLFSNLSCTYLSKSTLSSLPDKENFFDKYKCDVRDSEQVSDVLKQSIPDIILHMASTRYFPSPKNLLDHSDVNLLGLENVIKAVKYSKLNSKIIFVNSGAAKLEGDLSEKGSKVRDDYSMSKRTASDLFKKKKKSGEVLGEELRLFTPYGPWDYKYRLIQSTIIQLNNGINPILNNPNSRRDFVYISDVVDALIKTISKDEVCDSIIEIGSSKPKSIRDIFKKIHEIMGCEYKFQENIKNVGQEDITYMKADLKIASDFLYWVPNTSLEDGLKKTIEWTLSQAGDKFYG